MKKYLLLGLLSLSFCTNVIYCQPRCDETKGFKLCRFLTSHSPPVGIPNLPVKIKFSKYGDYGYVQTDSDGYVCLPLVGSYWERQGSVHFLFGNGDTDSISIKDIRNAGYKWHFENARSSSTTASSGQEEQNRRRLVAMKERIRFLEEEIESLKKDKQASQNLINSLVSRVKEAKLIIKELEEKNTILEQDIEKLGKKLSEIEIELNNAYRAWCETTIENFPRIVEFRCIPTVINKKEDDGKKARSIFDWRYVELSFQTGNPEHKYRSPYRTYHFEVYVELNNKDNDVIKLVSNQIIDPELSYPKGKIPIGIAYSRLINENHHNAVFELYCTVRHQYNENYKVIARIASGSYMFNDKDFNLNSWKADIRRPTFINKCP